MTDIIDPEAYILPLAISGMRVPKEKCEEAVAALHAVDLDDEIVSARDEDRYDQTTVALLRFGWADTGSAYSLSDRPPYPHGFTLGGIYGDAVIAGDTKKMLDVLAPFVQRDSVVVMGDRYGNVEVAYIVNEDDDGQVKEVDPRGVDSQMTYYVGKHMVDA